MIYRHRSVAATHLLVLTMLVSTPIGQAQSVATGPVPAHTIVSVDSPRDSRGEIVYEGAGSTHPDAPIVPGQLQVPRLLKLVQPKFPRNLRQPGNDGTVVVSGVISAKGDLIDLTIHKLSGFPKSSDGAAQSALAATSHYKFSPATLDGKPVALRVDISVDFRVF